LLHNFYQPKTVKHKTWIRILGVSEVRQELKNLLLELRPGFPGIALGLVAEVGAGKSFAVAEILSRVSCRSITVHATTSGAKLIAALPSVTNIPVWAQQTLDSVAEKSVANEEFIEAITAWLLQLSPCILQIEDFHEANSQQQHLWLQLASRATQIPGFGLLFTSRTPLASVIKTFQLEPLSTSAFKTLLENEAGTQLPHEALDWIESRTRGNPLFSLEYFRYLARNGFLWSDGQRWRWREPDTQSLPARVEALIEQALIPVLSSTLRSNALVAAALLGSALNFKTWAQVSGLTANQLQEIYLELIHYGIFYQDQFIHPLYREVLLSSPTIANREDIARQTLPYLAEHDPLHALKVLTWAKLNPKEQLKYFNIAIAHALEHNDQVLAARLSKKSARFLDRQAQVPVLLKAAKWIRPYQLSEALEMLQIANQIDPENLEVLRFMLEVLAYLGRAKEALSLLQRLPKNLPTDTWIEQRVMLLHRSFDYTGLLELWEKELKTQTVLKPMIARAIARALVHFKNYDAAKGVIDQSLSAQKLSALEQAQLLYAKAFIPNARGEFVESVRVCSELIEYLYTTGKQAPQFLELLEGAHQLRAYAHSALGHPRAAIADIEQCLIWLAQLGHAAIYAQRQSELGMYCLEAGDSNQAATLLLEARTVLERADQPVYACYLNRFSALYLLHLGDEKALQRAHMALRNAQQTQQHSFITGAIHTLALVEASLGSASKALDYTAELESLEGCTKTNILLIKALALERLGQPEKAIEFLENAVQTTERMYFEVPPERIKLELLRLTKNHQAARILLLQLQQSGQGQLIELLENYFPDVEAPETSAPLAVLGDIRWHGAKLGERGRKALELLAYLLEARIEKQSGVACQELFEILYPNHTDTQANAALKQMVYRMRGYLGAEAIVRQGNGYALGAFETDLEQFLKNPRPELWRGIYLSDLGLEHLSSIRGRLTQALRQLVSEMMQQQHTDTMRVAKILLEMDTTEPSTIKMVLQVAQQTGDTVSAIHAYAQAKTKLEELGETPPASWQVFLEEQLMMG
jgi:DNA-binding SARP family transcriptional activator